MFTIFQNVRCVCSGEIPRCRYFLNVFPLLLSPSECPDISFRISTSLNARQQRDCLVICIAGKIFFAQHPDRLRARTRILLLHVHGVISPGFEFDHLPVLSAEPKKNWTLCFHFHCAFMLYEHTAFYVVISDEGNSSPLWHFKSNI